MIKDNIVNQSVFEGYKNKLANKLYGLLCEREKDGKWEEFLRNIHIELFGLMDSMQAIQYWELMAKVGSLYMLNYKYFRQTIFDCINLVKELELNDELFK